MENPVSKQCRSDQMPHYVASDLGLHCLPMTLLWVSRLEWVKTDLHIYVFVLGIWYGILYHLQETQPFNPIALRMAKTL